MNFIKPIDENFPVDFAEKINNEVHFTSKKPLKNKSRLNFAQFSITYEIKLEQNQSLLTFRLEIYDNNLEIEAEIKKRLHFLFEHEGSIIKDGYFICIKSKIENCISDSGKNHRIDEFADVIDRVKNILNYHFEKNFMECLIRNEKDREIERIKEIEKRYYQFLKDPELIKGKYRKKKRKFVNGAYLFFKRLGVFKYNFKLTLTKNK